MFEKIKHVIAVLATAYKQLTVSQRKAIYKFAMAVGVAIVVKFGVDADSAATWIATLSAFISTVLVPILAHQKAVSD